MRESDIIHQNGRFWVARERGKRNAYVVYRDGATHATSDSAYTPDASGLSVAIARCNYLAKWEAEKSSITKP